jgi:transposase-like protein
VEVGRTKMAQRRRHHSGEFKAKVVIQALKGHKTVNEIAGLYGIHPVQVTQWKKQALEQLAQVFGERRVHSERAAAEEKGQLYEQIGRLKMELDWVKKKAGLLQ